MDVQEVGAEAVAPHGDAVRPIHHELDHPAVAQRLVQPFATEAFGRDIDQPQLPIDRTLHDLAPVAGRLTTADVVHTADTLVVAQLVHLIRHQRDQRRHHHGQPTAPDGRQLEGGLAQDRLIQRLLELGAGVNVLAGIEPSA